MPDIPSVRELQQNYLAELDSARLYHDLAAHEPNPQRQAILQRMAQAEERHAALWKSRLDALHAPLPAPSNSLPQRLARFLNRLSGTDLALRRQEAVEDRQAARYHAQQPLASPQDNTIDKSLHDMELEERAHARALSALAPTPPGPQARLDTLLRRERWHGRGGGWVADAIYGVNDGLGAVFGIVSGVAGATANQPHYVLIAGLAGMIASALSMGAGAFLAVKSEREVHQAELARERLELQRQPEEEQEEMALFYQLQGFDESDARRMAQRLAQHPEHMLRVMAQNELGLSEEHFRQPWVSALSASLSTAVGAFIPILPFFFLSGYPAILAAFAISLLAHFAVGAAKSLITTRSWWASGTEMTLIGLLEAAVTYSLGLAFAPLA